MSCRRPLDPLDLEALASGESPLVAPDAAGHAAACPECGRRLELFRGMDAWLAGAEPSPVPPALAGSVARLRAFSRREKWSLRVWAIPLSLCAALLAASGLALSIPVPTSAEQGGLWASALAAEARALLAWPRLLRQALPPALAALGDAARAERSLSAAAILLLIPVGFAVRRVLARRKIAP